MFQGALKCSGTPPTRNIDLSVEGEVEDIGRAPAVDPDCPRSEGQQGFIPWAVMQAGDLWARTKSARRGDETSPLRALSVVMSAVRSSHGRPSPVVMRLVVLLVDLIHGVVQEVGEDIVGDVLDLVFEVTVGVDREGLGLELFLPFDESIQVIDELVRGALAGVRLHVKLDESFGVDVHEGVPDGAVADVDTAGLTTADLGFAPELSGCDHNVFERLAALAAPESFGFADDGEFVHACSFP